MTASGPLVLVTGAGGFIGTAVVAALNARGFRVRAGVRREPRAPSQIRCDLDNAEEARAALEGVGIVVHAAYGDVSRMVAQNATLLEAMRRHGVDQLVTLSSIAVYGEAEGDVDEATPTRGVLDGYAAAKIECEKATRDWAAESASRSALMMRPGIVYGTGSPFWTIKLAERIRAGAWADFGPSGEGVAALIHVDDLAAMIAAAASISADGYRVVNAVGPSTPSWNAYFQRIAAKLGQPALPSLSAAQIASRQALATPAKIWRKLGLPGARAASLAPTAGEIALFSRSARYSTAAAEALGLRATIDVDEGLARTRID